MERIINWYIHPRNTLQQWRKTTSCNNMDESHRHNVAWKKPDSKECILFIWNPGAGRTNLWWRWSQEWLPLGDDCWLGKSTREQAGVWKMPYIFIWEVIREHACVNIELHTWFLHFMQVVTPSEYIGYMYACVRLHVCIYFFKFWSKRTDTWVSKTLGHSKYLYKHKENLIVTSEDLELTP